MSGANMTIDSAVAPTPGELLARAIDDVISPELAHALECRTAAHAGNFCPDRLRDLHDE